MPLIRFFLKTDPLRVAPRGLVYAHIRACVRCGHGNPCSGLRQGLGVRPDGPAAHPGSWGHVFKVILRDLLRFLLVYLVFLFGFAVGKAPPL